MCAAICWALLGINQAGYSESINTCSMSVFVVLLVLIIITGLNNLLTKRKPQKSQQDKEKDEVSVYMDVQPPQTEPPVYLNSYAPASQQQVPVYAYYCPQPVHEDVTPQKTY